MECDNALAGHLAKACSNVNAAGTVTIMVAGKVIKSSA